MLKHSKNIIGCTGGRGVLHSAPSSPTIGLTNVPLNKNNADGRIDNKARIGYRHREIDSAHIGGSRQRGNGPRIVCKWPQKNLTVEALIPVYITGEKTRDYKRYNNNHTLVCHLNKGENIWI